MNRSRRGYWQGLCLTIPLLTSPLLHSCTKRPVFKLVKDPNPIPIPIPNQDIEPNQGSFVTAHGELQVKGTKIIDRQGMPIQLRGMSLFWSQWSSQFWTRGTVNTLAQTWGATVIRAAMGVEDAGGYLSNPIAEKAKLKTIVDAAIANDIYVIIDWHSHYAHKNTDKAVAFFSEMAAIYATVPNVIFEIYNEPKNDVQWPEVKKYSERVIAAIRSKGAKNLVIVGSPTWSQDVDIAAADPIRDDNIAYTLHFYAATHKQDLRDKALKAMKQGAALFVTEFGICGSDGNGTNDIAEANTWMEFMDTHGLSWANWSLNNKPEKASALKQSASTQGPWSESDLTESGNYIKLKMSENLMAQQQAETIPQPDTAIR